MDPQIQAYFSELFDGGVSRVKTRFLTREVQNAPPFENPILGPRLVVSPPSGIFRY